MRFDSKEILIQELCGNHVDFYLEDDMFEIEGTAYLEDDKIIIRVLSAVMHIRRICGKFLELQVKNKRLYAQRIDTGKIFEMEINRIYKNLVDPTGEDFLHMKTIGVDQFFQKSTDTLVWFDPDQNNWTIEINKINMFSHGDRSSYENIEDLFKAHPEHMGGVWQAVLFSSSVMEGE